MAFRKFGAPGEGQIEKVVTTTTKVPEQGSSNDTFVPNPQTTTDVSDRPTRDKEERTDG